MGDEFALGGGSDYVVMFMARLEVGEYAEFRSCLAGCNEVGER